MGKIRCIIWEETKRTLGNRNSLILILSVVILGMLESISIGTNNEWTNGILVLFTMDKETVLHNEYLVFSHVAASMKGSYFIMFMPLIVGLAVIPVLSEDWESGRTRYVLMKCGRIKMLLGKLAASCISGGVIMFCGYMLAVTIMYTKLDHDVSFWALSASYGGVFIEGAVCALWCFLVSAFVRNPYLLACIPYIFLWFVERKTSAWFLEEVEVNKVQLYVYEVSQLVGNFFYDKQFAVQILLFYMGIAVLAMGLHLFMMRRRGDCGQ